MTHVATALHELEGHLVLSEHGLSPYWACSKPLRRRFDGYSGEVDFEH